MGKLAADMTPEERQHKREYNRDRTQRVNAGLTPEERERQLEIKRTQYMHKYYHDPGFRERELTKARRRNATRGNAGRAKRATAEARRKAAMSPEQRSDMRRNEVKAETFDESVRITQWMEKQA